MNKTINQTAFILLLGYCFFNLFNVMWFKVNIPFLVFWLVLCASFYAFRKMHTFASGNFAVPQSEALALSLIFLTFMAVMAQRVFLDGYVAEIGIDVTTKTFEFWSVSALWFFVGGACSSFKVKDSTTVAFIIVAIMALAFSRGLNDQLMIAWADVNADSNITSMSHLGMELFVIVPLALAFSMSQKSQWLVALIGIFFLYAMGGRTSLIMYIATIVFLAMKNNPLRNIFALSIVALVGWVGANYLVTSANIDIENKFVSDMLFIDGVEEDSSFQARAEFLLLNTQNFSEQFLFGNPTLFVKQNASMGGYIHNLLSAWEFYGFFCFLTFVALLAYSYRRMTLSLKHANTPIHRFGAFVLIYTIGSVIVGKSVLWFLLWFTLGFWLLKPSTSKRRKNRSKRYRSKGLKARPQSGTPV